MTISHVAKKAGVSKSTVSRVLNGKPGPSVSTVHRVLQAAEKLRYQPAPPGQRPGLRQAGHRGVKHGQIALVMLDDGFQRHGELFAQLVRGVITAAANHGLNVQLRMPFAAGEKMRLPGKGQIDGMLLAGTYPDSSALAELPEVPYVWLTSRQYGNGDQLLMGNEAAGVLAANYLMKCTRGAIGYLNPASLHPALRRRCDAFEFTLQDRGRDCVRMHADSDSPGARGGVHFDEIGGYLEPMVEKLSSLVSRLEGLFVPSDLWMAALHPMLRRRNLLPTNLVSCGNESAYLLGLDPKPVTIDLAQGVVGRHAVEQLVQQIQRPGTGPQIALTLNPSIIEYKYPTQPSIVQNSSQVFVENTL